MTTVTTFRPATDTEILADRAFEIRYGHKVMFRHFLRESYSPRARNGVKHVQYGRARIRVVDGAPFVHHHGKLQRVTASVMTTDEGSCVIDLRLASKYLENV